jgi:glycosyltransferase involved in cell wall biosynthesis
MGDVSGSKSLVAKAGNFIRANFFIPDARKGWVPFATKAAKELIEQENINQVITTGPPHSTHLVGRRLKKAFPDIFWIADFRDPWVNIYYNRHLSRTQAAWKKDKRLETSVLNEADLTSIASEGMRKEFENRAKDVLTIMNGYDEEDFPDSPQSGKEENFIVRYTGSFTDNQVIGSIWDVFSQVIEKHKLGDRIQFRFTGNVSQGIKNIIETKGLSDRVTLEDYCLHDEAVKKMIDADLLLLIIPDAPHNESIITAKIFEYLASGTPIFALGPPDGSASQVLRRCGRSPMLDYDDLDRMEKLLSSILTKWGKTGESRKKINSQSIKQFSRQEQGKKLLKILTERQ